MHDNKLHDEPDEWANGLSIELINSTIERLREQAEPVIEIDGIPCYVFRPFKGRAGYYDRTGRDE